ncbi:MAG: phospholipase D family protein [Gammaproteobacteria bacterium]|nr:phospholipase D family protein [Gammaproteobacteria bacterium]
MPNRFLELLVVSFLLLASGCASLPENTNRQASYALTDTDDTSFGRKSAARIEIQGNGQDGFLLLESGLDAFVARALLAHYAERSIDLQYYLYHRDLVGRLLMNKLIQAADRGVRVRLLIDDMDLGGRDDSLLALHSHPNIEMRVFNPFDRKIGRMSQFVTGFGSVTRRMHNKSFTVDNQVTIVGGRNIGNEYFDADPTLEFSDLDVMAIGNVVQDVSYSFDLYWNSELAYPVTTIIENRLAEEETDQLYQKLQAYIEEHRDNPYLTALRGSDLANTIRQKNVVYQWGKADVVYDLPEKISSDRDATELHLMTQLAPYFHAVEKELIIYSPYFVPGKEGVEFFQSLTDRGVRVRILTNSLASNDVSVVHAGYAKYRKALLRAGVELYEKNKKLTRTQRKEKKGVGSSSKASLHAKSFVLDREKVFIGSLNLDPRSFYENSEIGVVISSAETAASMAEEFEQTVKEGAFRLELVSDDEYNEYILWHGYENGVKVTFEYDPYTSIWRRMGVGFMRIMPIESQL